MKRLRGFEYHEPVALTDAIRILAGAEGRASLLAGGTDLIVDMKMGRVRPSCVVNLKHVPDLSGIASVAGGTRIGALTKVTDVAESALVQRRHPGLAQAASLLASPPVRALATVGGNVGRASPASDLGPALMVHQARTAIAGHDGTREEPVEELYAGPGVTTLASSDIMTSFFLPEPPPRFGSAYVKLGKRGSGTDIALAGAAVGVAIGEDGEIADCRVALTSLGPTPFRATGTEALLRGAVPTPATLARAAESAGREARPIGDMRATAAYRTTLARVLTGRALRAAVRSAGTVVGP